MTAVNLLFPTSSLLFLHISSTLCSAEAAYISHANVGLKAGCVQTDIQDGDTAAAEPTFSSHSALVQQSFSSVYEHDCLSRTALSAEVKQVVSSEFCTLNICKLNKLRMNISFAHYSIFRLNVFKYTE